MNPNILPLDYNTIYTYSTVVVYRMQYITRTIMYKIKYYTIYTNTTITFLTSTLYLVQYNISYNTLQLIFGENGWHVSWARHSTAGSKCIRSAVQAVVLIVSAGMQQAVLMLLGLIVVQPNPSQQTFSVFPCAYVSRRAVNTIGLLIDYSTTYSTMTRITGTRYFIIFY